MGPKNDVNSENQIMWATMSDESAFAFALKHPEYADKFQAV